MSDYMLGIESSCDETCASVVQRGRVILSNVIQSSALIHEKYGGVVPEIASRKHLEAIVPVIDCALQEAGLGWKEIEAIGVTSGPGLVGSLLVGVSAAKMLAFATGKPLVPIHHLAGHIAANYLEHPDLEPPFLALVISGAHSHLVAVKDPVTFQIIGRTRDDAPGEAFDKVAREIGLGYPGGPKIDRVAPQGNPKAFKLPKTRFQDSLDFSFSGIKTAVLNELNKAEMKAQKMGCDRDNILSTKDIAATFQETVCETLAEHTAEALEQTGYRQLVLAGGVSANSKLRERMSQLCQEKNIPLKMPSLPLCTDNAAMIAAQTFYEYQAGKRAQLTLNARASWELGTPFA